MIFCLQERCDGLSSQCPAIDAVQASTVICRASQGVCDAAERCDGATPRCPPDVVHGSDTVCREARPLSGCDVEELCSGVPGEFQCPQDIVARKKIKFI